MQVYSETEIEHSGRYWQRKLQTLSKQVYCLQWNRSSRKFQPIQTENAWRVLNYLPFADSLSHCIRSSWNCSWERGDQEGERSRCCCWPRRWRHWPHRCRRWRCPRCISLLPCWWTPPPLSPHHLHSRWSLSSRWGKEKKERNFSTTPWWLMLILIFLRARKYTIKYSKIGWGLECCLLAYNLHLLLTLL